MTHKNEPQIITLHDHPDCVRVITSPSLKDSFFEANKMLDEHGVRGVVWIPTNYDTQNVEPDLAIYGFAARSQWYGKAITPTGCQRRISTLQLDEAALSVDQPHIDDGLPQTRRCVHTAYGLNEKSGTIIYDAVPEQKNFRSDGDVYPDAKHLLGYAWQLSAGSALFMLSDVPTHKKLIHNAPAMPTDDCPRTISAKITRVVDVYDYKVRS